MTVSGRVDLYDNVYGDFASRAETEIRRAAFGVDIGQSSWLTAEDWLRFAYTGLAVTRAVSDRTLFRAIDASGSLPFPDGSFDAVLSNDAMCHIPHRREVLRDWHRVLRPGGRMLLSLIHISEPTRLLSI